MREIKFEVVPIYDVGGKIEVIAKGGDTVVVNFKGTSISIDGKELADNLNFAITFAGNKRMAKSND
jgi:ketosteroid isomerase-like protein